MEKIKPGRYQHYKGRFYEVIGEARDSETLEEMVVYIALYETKFGSFSLWVRSKKMFLGYAHDEHCNKISRPPYAGNGSQRDNPKMFLEKVKIDDKEIPRFKLVE